MLCVWYLSTCACVYAIVCAKARREHWMASSNTSYLFVYLLFIYNLLLNLELGWKTTSLKNTLVSILHRTGVTGMGATISGYFHRHWEFELRLLCMHSKLSYPMSHRFFSPFEIWSFCGAQGSLDFMIFLPHPASHAPVQNRLQACATMTRYLLLVFL